MAIGVVGADNLILGVGVVEGSGCETDFRLPVNRAPAFAKIPPTDFWEEKDVIESLTGREASEADTREASEGWELRVCSLLLILLLASVLWVRGKGRSGGSSF